MFKVLSESPVPRTGASESGLCHKAVYNMTMYILVAFDTYRLNTAKNRVRVAWKSVPLYLLCRSFSSSS